MNKKLGSIHMLNIGWEDAIILQSAGHFALIDAGEPGRGAYIVDYLQRLAGHAAVHLDFIIGTHSHVDHMGGFPYILEHPHITVGKAFLKHEPDPDLADEIDRGHYQNFLTGCDNKGIEVVQHNLGNVVLTLGSMTVTLLNGTALTGCSTNEDSLCQLVQVGDFNALLAADMTGESRELEIGKTINGTVDLLKIGHHGLRDSTGRKFAKKLRPSVAVYTNGSSWEVESHDVTLGVKKGLDGYRNLKKIGTTQYVTTDNGGIVAVIDEHSVEYHAIKEFTQKGDSLLYERRDDIVLREITPP
ncbi:MAG: MBL fold metallo-hydrolase [Oscillospiraceae bacterium]|nr:MBL fold metallo-hydrolase [Oscillospiraceae bacterium]